uniref:Uncharacterized protein ycf23 n=1 Tax=Cumathamnion serrulatum TaxID=1206573 RepID=A0A7U1G3T5_9FLOR|nr:hypothetical protein K4Y23_pgp178 [Cumathamnion serrulatum]QQY85296.1 hypothetical protein [Cumathamnion serrulatum]
MNLFNRKLLIPFKSKKIFKVICGLSNVNINELINTIKAAELANANYIDLVANTKIVSIVKNITNLPICVSSIDPIELYNCILAGADLVEIGNFDSFYKKNILFSPSQILELAKETRRLIKSKDICVTIPYTLKLIEQVSLAKQLESIGINIIQTEGCNIYNSNSYSSKNSQIMKSAINASYSLCSTYVVSNSVNIPVITSSGLDLISSSIAFYCGASGIGIGSNIIKQKNIYDMYLYINEIRNSINIQFNNHNFQAVYLSMSEKIKKKSTIN